MEDLEARRLNPDEPEQPSLSPQGTPQQPGLERVPRHPQQAPRREHLPGAARPERAGQC